MDEYECPYCGKPVTDDQAFYDCESDGKRWREHEECADDADAAK